MRRLVKSYTKSLWLKFKAFNRKKVRPKYLISKVNAKLWNIKMKFSPRIFLKKILKSISYYWKWTNCRLHLRNKQRFNCKQPLIWKMTNEQQIKKIILWSRKRKDFKKYLISVKHQLSQKWLILKRSIELKYYLLRIKLKRYESKPKKWLLWKN